MRTTFLLLAVGLNSLCAGVSLFGAPAPGARSSLDAFRSSMSRAGSNFDPAQCGPEARIIFAIRSAEARLYPEDAEDCLIEGQVRAGLRPLLKSTVRSVQERWRSMPTVGERWRNMPRLSLASARQELASRVSALHEPAPAKKWSLLPRREPREAPLS